MAKQRITYRFRLYPTRSQVEALTYQLSEACRLYNAALQERRDAWRIGRVSLSFYDQDAQLKDIRAAGDIGISNFSCSRNVLRQVDRTFRMFFDRLRAKAKSGYPRFKSSTRFDSITFPDYGHGCRLMDNGKLRLQGIGLLKVKLHRPIKGKIKTLTIKREGKRWYACFSVEREMEPLPECFERVGLDVGLLAFATLSDGTEVDNPRWYREAQAKLRRAQRRVCRRKKGSQRRRKAVHCLRQAHKHIHNQRADFHHKISRWLVNNHGFIAVEDLNVQGLAKGILAKSVHDAGWSGFLQKLTYKAENAGRELWKVNPSGTSQTCLCGASTPKTLSQRWHECLSCGLSAGRDHVSAQVILNRALGLSVLALSRAIA